MPELKFEVDPEEAHWGLKPGLHTLAEVATFLRENQYDHEVVSFVATLLQCGFLGLQVE